MQSKRSFFNKTVFTKTMSRFWPLWLGYAVLWMIVLPIVLGTNLRYGYADTLDAVSYILETSIYGGVIIGAFFAAFAAFAVWSFMYNARSTHGMAVLPIRREGVFASVTLAGITPMLAGNVLVFIVTLATAASYGVNAAGAIFQWLAVVTLILVFFYGFAIFCAQLTGNLVVFPLVYGVLNFTAIVVEAIMRMLLSTFVYGMRDSGGFTFGFLSPVYQYLTNLQCRSVYTELVEEAELIGYRFEGWATLGIYAAVGIVFAAAALLLYRKRRMEAAGDVVAVNGLKPVFKYCLSAGCALVLGYMFYWLIMDLSYTSDPDLEGMLPLIGFMLIGAFVGYFAAQMLIKKSFRVWKQGWAGFGITALVIVGLMVSMECNLFGYETYIPKTGRIESVTVIGNGDRLRVSQPENVEAIRALHSSIVSKKAQYEELQTRERFLYSSERELNSVNFRFEYFLTNGSMVERQYTLFFYPDDPASYKDVAGLQNIANSTEAIANRYETEVKRENAEILETVVRANVPGKTLAAIKGYGSVEEFMLGYYNGISEDQMAAMSDEEKTFMLADVARQYAVNFESKYFNPKIVFEKAESVDVTAVPTYADPLEEIYGLDYEVVSEIDFESLWFQDEWILSSDEAAELYEECILPDLREGTIGGVWHVADDEYKNSVYNANIGVDIRYLSEDEGRGYSYDYYSFQPQTNSARTVRWLERHGVKLYTVAQQETMENE